MHLPAARRIPCYFLAAGFDLSCLGFLFFLSFFCELLPLPIVCLLLIGGCRAAYPLSIGRNLHGVQYSHPDCARGRTIRRENDSFHRLGNAQQPDVRDRSWAGFEGGGADPPRADVHDVEVGGLCGGSRGPVCLRFLRRFFCGKSGIDLRSVTKKSDRPVVCRHVGKGTHRCGGWGHTPLSVERKPLQHLHDRAAPSRASPICCLHRCAPLGRRLPVTAISNVSN